MEAEEQRRLEKVLSQKALSMSSSFPCQICVVGFLCGVCLTSLFLAGLTSFGSFALGGISFRHISSSVSPWNSSSSIISMVAMGDCTTPKARGLASNDINPNERRGCSEEEKVSHLYSSWTAFLNESKDLWASSGARVPKAPHIENCKRNAEINKRLDTRLGNETFPPWTLWKGSLDIYSETAEDKELNHLRHQDISEGAHPPWVTGPNEENYPLTRKVQRDIWLHQHPVNCRDPQVKFLVADWERIPGFGIGAQIAGICGLLAIAITENRVLVTKYYNRADHDGCKGSSRASWSCYFLPETYQECRDRAFELMNQQEAWDNGIIKAKENYTSKEMWAGRIPRNWGTPWSYLQPTTEINGSFTAFHRKMDRRWWRAQAVRYLMRFPTDYTCHLMNVARHAAFGREAAEMVLANNNGELPGEAEQPSSEIERYVWSNHEPWIPRPLLSMHVRMGDKASEMKVVQFKDYMRLANRLRNHFPNLKSIWLSTEMQEVIDLTKLYTPLGWTFYFTNVRRQVSNMSMAAYESSLGRRTSTEYPLVNFLMATEADFFIGALGSTWSFLIDGMRNTGGKVMAGYLSVNKDRFW